jgi:RluA family pseudouridine synthase
MAGYNIIYEDEFLIVVEKPPGILVIPTRNDEKNTLTSLLNQYLDRQGIEVNAYPCHRLDRETSGLILYAKGKKVRQLMMDEFKKKAVKKKYVTFVHGVVKQNSGIINTPIYNRNKRRSDNALTKYNVIKRQKTFTVLEVEPVTGRTNQIRIHLKSIGHPVVGESVYAFRKDYELRFKRTALHAERLEFSHPINGQMMSFASSIPEDMANFLKAHN